MFTFPTIGLHRKACALIAALALAAPILSTSPARGAEGMWTFDNFPAQRMAADFGWAPNQDWLARVMQGVARLPNCSAAMVSSQGLAITNEHCLTDCLERVSPDGANYIDTGFAAQGRASELRCPGLALQVLAGITDVAGRIEAAAASAPPDAFARVRNAEIARIVDECAGTCEVETLYQGGRYALYRYRRFDDVRLVFAPERAIAAFGGDEDNFEFPRFSA